jgi:hypothetical protein
MSEKIPETPNKGKNEESGGKDASACGAGVSPPVDAKDSLPCLYSNNSTENQEKPPPDENLNKLCPYHKKQAEVLFRNTKTFIEMHGLENVGFLTLTFKDNVKCNKESGRRFNSLSTHFLSEHFGEWMLVKERQKRGAWHYHLLIDCQTDIRTGFNFEGIKIRDYSSACDGLRSYWSLLRSELPKFGFGRSELLPVMSNSEGLARYVGKYISKHVGSRSEEDKGVRLFSCSKGFKSANVNFAWNSVGSWLWRMKVKEFAKGFGIREYDDIKKKMGNKWAWQWGAIIEDQKLPRSTIYPTLEHWQRYEEFGPHAVPHDVPLDMVKQNRVVNIRVHKLQQSRYTAVEFDILPADMALPESKPEPKKSDMPWEMRTS